MLVWMFYVILVSLLLSVAAFSAEHASRIRPGISRWIWLTTILASLLLPVLMSSVVIQVPSIASPTAIERVIPLNSVTSSALSPVRWITSSGNDVTALSRLDPILKKTWLVVSLLLAIGLAVSALNLMRCKRSWRSESLNGIDVYVSRDAGPAIVGLLQPRIVIPEWILQASVGHQTVILAHEQSHLDAGDQKLLTVSVCLLVFMPWNLPLWWQLRRLRRAIEVDCDTRVLRHGHSVSNYGEVLIEVGQRQSTFIGTVAAMSESISFLEQRIRIMTNIPTKLWKISTAAFAILSIGLLTAATQVSPPNTGFNSADQTSAKSEAPQEIRQSALAWLGVVDSGNYVESWNKAAPFFKQQLTSGKWEQALTAVRTPLGKMVSRDITSASQHTSLPGAPDGEYTVISLATTFEHKQMAVETVTVMNVGEQWRVVGYFIK